MQEQQRLIFLNPCYHLISKITGNLGLFVRLIISWATELGGTDLPGYDEREKQSGLLSLTAPLDDLKGNLERDRLVPAAQYNHDDENSKYGKECFQE